MKDEERLRWADLYATLGLDAPPEPAPVAEEAPSEEAPAPAKKRRTTKKAAEEGDAPPRKRRTAKKAAEEAPPEPVAAAAPLP
ncbi:MAG: hypothetical protein K2W96_08695, partial [Gemmataceae bacterium]|nr:hypothetical protein [Gemmataceae bacterium]